MTGYVTAQAFILQKRYVTPSHYAHAQAAAIDEARSVRQPEITRDTLPVGRILKRKNSALRNPHSLTHWGIFWGILYPRNHNISMNTNT